MIFTKSKPLPSNILSINDMKKFECITKFNREYALRNLKDELLYFNTDINSESWKKVAEKIRGSLILNYLSYNIEQIEISKPMMKSLEKKLKTKQFPYITYFSDGGLCTYQVVRELAEVLNVINCEEKNNMWIENLRYIHFMIMQDVCVQLQNKLQKYSKVIFDIYNYIYKKEKDVVSFPYFNESTITELAKMSISKLSETRIDKITDYTSKVIEIIIMIEMFVDLFNNKKYPNTLQFTYFINSCNSLYKSFYKIHA